MQIFHEFEFEFEFKLKSDRYCRLKDAERKQDAKFAKFAKRE